MPVTLSIKGVSDDLAEALRARAKRNHRSIQGELMEILQNAIDERPFQAQSLLARVRALGVRTPDEARSLVRAARDTR